jgi:hypothetical protein
MRQIIDPCETWPRRVRAACPQDLGSALRRDESALRRDESALRRDESASLRDFVKGRWVALIFQIGINFHPMSYP